MWLLPVARLVICERCGVRTGVRWSFSSSFFVFAACIALSGKNPTVPVVSRKCTPAEKQAGAGKGKRSIICRSKPARTYTPRSLDPFGESPWACSPLGSNCSRPHPIQTPPHPYPPV